MKQFDSGAKSSEVAPRLDLIPPASLRRQAARMAEGAASHGERNYEKGASDPAFIRDRKNHLAWHVAQYISGDVADDHLGAILANAGMLARLEELAIVSPDVHELAPRRQSAGQSAAVGISHDERMVEAQPPTCGCAVLTYPPGKCVKCARVYPK